MKKVLVVAAHPDDEVLGVGATIRKHVENDDECYALILGEGETSRYEKRELHNKEKIIQLQSHINESAKIIGFKKVFIENLKDNRFDNYDLLDIVKLVESYIEKINPDIIYTHHYGDVNIDHKLTFDAVLTATRPIGDNYVKEIYCFETVSSTEWNFKNNCNFKPNYFVDVTNTINYKIDAMKKYKNELREYPHPRSLENLEFTARKWGSVISVNYAEAFEIVRIIKR